MTKLVSEWVSEGVKEWARVDELVFERVSANATKWMGHKAELLKEWVWKNEM